MENKSPSAEYIQFVQSMDKIDAEKTEFSQS